MIAFAPAPFSLALSYNRLVLASLKHVKIGRNHSGATVPCDRRSVLVEFRGRRNTLELFVQTLWQAQYFGLGVDFVAGTSL